MNSYRTRQAQSLQRIRADLVARLRERSSEIEEAILARVIALSESSADADAEYMEGLRATVAESVEYGFGNIEHGEEWSGSIPAAAVAQARRAARNGISLDTVMRRYAAGDRLLGEFIMDEADRFPSQALRQVLSSLWPQVDRLTATVAAEYRHEVERIRRTPSQRLAERVQRLLAGDEPADGEELDYEFDAWHVGLVVMGAKGEGALRALAAALDRQLLIIPRGEEFFWAWLGGRLEPAVSEIEGILSSCVPDDVSLAVGEPRKEPEGWRLTHQEAQAALQVMLRRPQKLIRGREVALLASVLRDEALTKSLLETYLAPLDAHGDSGAVLRKTLRAYFESGCNAVTAAAALEVDRHTVQRRLRKIEDALGQLIRACHSELDVALRLEELTGTVTPRARFSAPDRPRIAVPH